MNNPVDQTHNVIHGGKGADAGNERNSDRRRPADPMFWQDLRDAALSQFLGLPAAE